MKSAGSCVLPNCSYTVSKTANVSVRSSGGDLTVNQAAGSNDSLYGLLEVAVPANFSIKVEMQDLVSEAAYAGVFLRCPNRYHFGVVTDAQANTPSFVLGEIQKDARVPYLEGVPVSLALSRTGNKVTMTAMQNGTQLGTKTMTGCDVGKVQIGASTGGDAFKVVFRSLEVAGVCRDDFKTVKAY